MPGAPTQQSSERRFFLKVSWLFNTSAFGAALVVRSFLKPVLHACGDPYEPVVVGAVVAAVMELAATVHKSRPMWRVRTFTYLMVLITFTTPAGLHAIANRITGV
ncbi:hypothetical protein ACFFHI_28570 [Streptomyces palmae]|uniref:Uncharacterized protein n=1 Tax=Streptomyces palmae TaxID=1701085 RepID=A0A4Z0H9V2_9ACTN|nr:hypothetical protein E4099_08220 [Streptomyces palmae]